jgi:hypothetical protein
MKKAPCERCVVNAMCRESCDKYTNYVTKVFTGLKPSNSTYRIAVYIKKYQQKTFNLDFKISNYHAGLFEVRNSTIKLLKIYKCRPKKRKDPHYDSSIVTL